MVVVERRGDFVKQLETRSYRDLKVWQRAMGLATSCYEVTAAFPVSDTYGMTTQIRRAAAAVPATIANGHGRQNIGSFVRFLEDAQGALKEVETYLLLARRVKLASSQQIKPLLGDCEEVGKMLRGLVGSLRSGGANRN